MTTQAEYILRLPEVKRRTGKCRSAIYAGMKTGDFPRSVRLGKRSVGWTASSIDTYIAERIQSSAE